ncbi:glycosyltransferase family 4 protein [Microbacterium hominis]|uniref:Glycosyltransferase family 4 protein n=1 Tax=Microbacterium hominis TaxID=162426 RepID=A0A7D4UC60_9MICO|nr:glycosyltransferase family 4 protein [Microbacterium hominis]QKJ20243.1 glycosyltransferase family 4 protein [Microbacterium hominis]
MKLVVLTDSPEVWGAEKSLLTLLPYLSGSFDTKVVVSTGSPLRLHVESLGIQCDEHVFNVTAPRDGQRRRWTGVRALAGSSRLRAQIQDADVVLIFSAWLLPEALLATKAARVPVVLDLHETFSAGFRRRVLGSFFWLCDKVISPSHSTFEMNGLRVPRGAAIIPRPVQVPPGTGRDVHRSNTIGVFGQIVPHKNVLELVQSVAWQQSPHQLAIVGGEPDASRRSAYENAVRDAAAAGGSSVRVIDRVADVFPLMAECTALINCSRHEAFGRTIAEAAMMGTVPIAVGRTGAAEVTRTIAFGRSVAEFDELQDLITTGELMTITAEERSAGQQRAVATFDAATVAVSYRDALQQVTKKRRPKASKKPTA